MVVFITMRISITKCRKILSILSHGRRHKKCLMCISRFLTKQQFIFVSMAVCNPYWNIMPGGVNRLCVRRLRRRIFQMQTMHKMNINRHKKMVAPHCVERVIYICRRVSPVFVCNLIQSHMERVMSLCDCYMITHPKV